MECVLCDWVFDSTGIPRAAYLPGDHLPLRWSTTEVTGVHVVRPDERMIDTVPYVALAAHWAEVHTEQLAALLDSGIQIDTFPRQNLPVAVP